MAKTNDRRAVVVLIEYLGGLVDTQGKATKARQEAFAAACGTSLGYLRQVAVGVRLANGELCIAIERETNGAVCCEDLRPDWDWQVVRNQRNAVASNI